MPLVQAWLAAAVGHALMLPAAEEPLQMTSPSLLLLFMRMRCEEAVQRRLLRMAGQSATILDQFLALVSILEMVVQMASLSYPCLPTETVCESPGSPLVVITMVQWPQLAASMEQRIQAVVLDLHQ